MTPSTRRISLRRAPWGALLCATAFSCIALVGCGGGGDDTPAAAAAAPSAAERAVAYTAGPVSGFGSVIVNGVRFNDDGAAVVDDDGVRRLRDDVKLGMHVAVDSTAVVGGASRALQVRMHDALLGPVQAVDAAAGTLTVLGQTVSVGSTTVYGDGLGNLASLTVGQVVAVHGAWDAGAATPMATRIELKTGAPYYRLRGTVANLDTTARTFTLGSAVIRYAGVTLPSGATALANGVTVRVALQTTAVNGQWVAQSLRTDGTPRLEDRTSGHLRGTVTAFTSTAAFSVNGTPVDASAATFPDGTSGLVAGARVEVEGAIVNGTLVATRVELDDRHAPSRHAFELHGAIGNLDAAAKTFVLRGVTVSYAGSVSYTGGTEATLGNGVKVEVKGTPGSTRATLTATSIRFE